MACKGHTVRIAKLPLEAYIAGWTFSGELRSAIATVTMEINLSMYVYVRLEHVRIYACEMAIIELKP